MSWLKELTDKGFVDITKESWRQTREGSVWEEQDNLSGNMSPVGRSGQKCRFNYNGVLAIAIGPRDNSGNGSSRRFALRNPDRGSPEKFMEDMRKLFRRNSFRGWNKGGFLYPGYISGLDDP